MDWYLKLQRGFSDMLNSPKANKKEWAFMLLQIAAVALNLLGWTALLSGMPLVALLCFLPGIAAGMGCLVILWRR